jgi:hypothetical protein
VVGGPLRVDGEVRGAAVVLGGDLEVGGAGRVGRALALGGAVDVEPGGVAPTWPVATLRMPTPASPAAPPRSTLLDDLRSLAQRGATYRASRFTLPLLTNAEAVEVETAALAVGTHGQIVANPRTQDGAASLLLGRFEAPPEPEEGGEAQATDRTKVSCGSSAGGRGVRRLHLQC